MAVDRTSELSRVGLATSQNGFPANVGDYLVLTVKYQNNTAQRYDLSRGMMGAFDLGFSPVRTTHGIEMHPDLFLAGTPGDYPGDRSIFRAGAKTFAPCILPPNGTTECEQFVDLSPTSSGDRVRTPADISVIGVSDGIESTKDVELGIALYTTDPVNLAKATGISQFHQVGPRQEGEPTDAFVVEQWMDHTLATQGASCDIYRPPVHLPLFGTIYNCGAQEPGQADTTETLCAGLDKANGKIYNVSQQVSDAVGDPEGAC